MRPCKKDNLGHSQTLVPCPTDNSHTVCSTKFLHFSSSSVPSFSHYEHFFFLLHSEGVVRFVQQVAMSDSSRSEPLGQKMLLTIRTIRNILILISTVLKIRPEYILKSFPLILLKFPLILLKYPLILPKYFQNWHYILLDICRFPSLLLT